MSGITVSLTTEPDQYTTVNAINGSHLYYQAVSASFSVPAFQYIFDVYEIDQFSQAAEAFIGKFTAPPRPITGDGIFTPYRPLQTYVNNEPVDFSVTLKGITAVSASMVEYRTNYGFEWNPSYLFSTLDVFTDLTLTFSTHVDILPGDQITLSMNTNLYNPQYNTSYIVQSIGTISGHFVAILPPGTYGNTPPTGINETGYVTNLQRIVGTGATAWAWNGTRQYNETQNFYNEFVLTGLSSDRFLTSYDSGEVYFGGLPIPQNIKSTRLGQYETIGFISDPVTDPIGELAIIGFDSQGNQIINVTTGATGINYPYRKYEIGIGPQNLKEAYGVDVTGCTFYEVIPVRTSGFIELGAVLRRIDYTCIPCYYQNFQLSWLNARGSYEYFNFYKDSQQSITVITNEMRKVLPWNYTIGDRERTVLSQQAQESWTINTDWLSEYDYNWLYKEIIVGAEAYLIDSNHNRIPIIITDKDGQAKTIARDELFNFKVSFDYASQINVQGN